MMNGWKLVVNEYTDRRDLTFQFEDEYVALREFGCEVFNVLRLGLLFKNGKTLMHKKTLLSRWKDMTYSIDK